MADLQSCLQQSPTRAYSVHKAFNEQINNPTYGTMRFITIGIASLLAPVIQAAGTDTLGFYATIDCER